LSGAGHAPGILGLEDALPVLDERTRQLIASCNMYSDIQGVVSDGMVGNPKSAALSGDAIILPTQPGIVVTV
jgi:hypothetical protein